MTRDTTIAALLRDQPFVPRLDDLVETLLDTLDDREKESHSTTLPARCSPGRRSVATNNTRPQRPIIRGSHGRTLPSQGDEDGDKIAHVPARLSDKARLRCFKDLQAIGTWQKVARIEDSGTSLINGSATWTLVQTMSQRRISL